MNEALDWLVREAQTSEVLAGGVRWRIQAICSEDLIRRDAVLLLGVPVKALQDGSTARLDKLRTNGEAAAKAADAAAAALARAPDDPELQAANAAAEARAREALEALQAFMRKLGPEYLEEAAATRRKIVCAGLVGMQSPRTGEWYPVRAVEGAGHDPATDTLDIARLPPSVLSVLSEAIEALSRGGAWAKALDSLQPRPGAAGRAGRGGDQAADPDPGRASTGPGEPDARADGAAPGTGAP